MPEAQYNLGSIYLDGSGVVQNFSKAFSNFLLSAENGFEMSQYKLSLMFLNGWGTDTDKIKAFMWINIAASGNHEPSIKKRDELMKILCKHSGGIKLLLLDKKLKIIMVV